MTQELFGECNKMEWNVFKISFLFKKQKKSEILLKNSQMRNCKENNLFSAKSTCSFPSTFCETKWPWTFYDLFYFPFFFFFAAHDLIINDCLFQRFFFFKFNFMFFNFHHELSLLLLPFAQLNYHLKYLINILMEMN